jgi:flagellin
MPINSLLPLIRQPSSDAESEKTKEMSTVINSNPAATLAAYNLGRTNENLQRSLNRLSSGSRINSSFDDAGGLAVSMKMSASIRRAESYAANIQNARSFLETQDGALKQLGNLLERMSELKTLAHDVTKNDEDVMLYETEYVQLQEQFRITVAEEFNGIPLFSPTDTPEHLYLNHPELGEEIQVSRPALGELHTGDALSIGEGKVEFSLIEAPGVFSWTSAASDAASRGGKLAVINSLETQIIINDILPNDPFKAYYIDGSDSIKEGEWLLTDGSPITFWSGAPPNGDGDYLTVTTGGWYGPFGGWNDVKDITYSKYNEGYILEKNTYLSLRDLPWSDLDATILQVAEARAQNGAEQMRLQMAADLNTTNIVNKESAVSRIKDVDIAEESAMLARSRVLQQAGTAMLAQANQSSQSILKLIEMN